MGLFDRIRNGAEEEVELRPDAMDEEEPWSVGDDRRPERDSGGRLERDVDRSLDDSDAVDADEGGDDEFILPGMKQEAADTASTDTGSDGSHGRSRDRSAPRGRSSRGSDRSAGASVDRVVEQNERIIELLEDITDKLGDGR